MTPLLAIIRAVHFAACLLPLSVFGMSALVVNPTMAWMIGEAASLADPCGFVETFHRRVHRLLAACLALAFVSGFLWLWFSIAGMSGSSLRESLNADLFKMVLTQTPPGRVWLLRAGIALALAGAYQRGFKTARGPFWLCTLLSASLAGSLAWLGHAAAAEGVLADIHLGADVLHLLTAAVWPGGLLPFALLPRPSLRSSAPIEVHCVATRRFSSVSLMAVGVLAASGSVNSYCLVGNLDALFSTEYGRLLLLKLGLFAAIVTLGAVNLLRLKPALSGLPGRAANDGAVLRKLSRNVRMELCLAAAILLVVGILGVTPPARQDADAHRAGDPGLGYHP